MKEDLFHHVIQQGTLLSNIIEELPNDVAPNFMVWRVGRSKKSEITAIKTLQNERLIQIKIPRLVFNITNLEGLKGC